MRAVGEILCGPYRRVRQRRMTALGQQRKSEAAPGMSALEGEADEIAVKADVAFQLLFKCRLLGEGRKQIRLPVRFWE